MARTRYAEAAELAQYLDQLDPDNNADEETLMNVILDRATDIVDNALGAERETNFFDGYTNGTTKKVRAPVGAYFTIPSHDIGTVTQVKQVGGDIVSTDLYEELDDGTLYAVNADGFEGDWGAAYYEITADWGRGAVPEAVVEVVLELAVNIWKSKDAGFFREIGNAREGGMSLEHTGGLTSGQRQTLEDAQATYKSLTI